MAVLLPRQTNPSGSFTHPGPGPRQSWALDTTQNITYTTVFSSYTVALWQQSASGGGADLGPVLLYKQDSSLPQTSFLWTVQLYDFSLAKSDVFFFWIFDSTDAAAQGVVPAPSVSSAYFTIREVDLVTTTTASGTSITTTAKKASNNDGATGTSSATGGASVPAAATGSGDGGGVNVVAVGVGVGVGVLVLAGLVALAVWWWLWKKTTVLDGLKRRAGSGKGDGPAEMDSSPQAPDTNKTFTYPVAGYNELGVNRVAELSVAPVAVEMGAVTGTVGPKETTAELPRAELA